MTTEQTADQEQDALILSLARVAYEVSCSVSVSYGDYSSRPWETLSEADQKLYLARAQAFLNNPGMHPTSEMGTAIAVMSAQDRAKAYVFHGAIQAIAREQSRG